MKKLIILIIAVVSIITLCACVGKIDTPSTQSDNDSETTSTETMGEEQSEIMHIGVIGFSFDLPKDAREVEGRAAGIATSDKCYACGDGDETVVVEAEYTEASGVPDIDTAVASIHAEDEYVSESYITRKGFREGRRVTYPTMDADGKTMYATCYVFVAENVYGEITFLQYSEDTEIQDLVLNSLNVYF